MNLTEKILQLIESKKITKTELSKMLGVSRPTIYERLQKKNWKKLEKLELSKIL
jgi:predicted DNA-binding transcriptional regulator AlpA